MSKQIDQDRRDAKAWAQEWQIRQKNLRIVKVVAAIAIIALLYFAIKFITVFTTRTTFSSEEAMRAALQGRFETDYCEDIEIIGDDITLTYYEISHYDRDYAERWGYSEYGDSVYDDKIIKWDYRKGIIKCNWMNDIKVDKDGNLVYYNQKFVPTDDPKPEPIDPSTLKNGKSGQIDADIAEDETQEEAETAQDSLEQTEEAAEEAGVLPEGDSTGA